MVSQRPSNRNGINIQKHKKRKQVEEEKRIRKHRKRKKEVERKGGGRSGDRSGVQWQSATSQAIWFSALLDSALGASLSQLERTPPLSEETFMELEGERDSYNISKHVRRMFGEAWEHSLCKEEGNKEKGNPALLVLCSSATRCVEMLKGLRSLTKACKPAKLFAKHIKVEEQVKALEDYVNIAVGTPNRVKKLIDIGALGLGALEVILLDMHADAKGFTIFTIPQVKSDLLELCRAHFHEQAFSGKLKFCLY